MPLTWCRFCNMTLDVDLTSGDTAFGGDDSIEDGVPNPFRGWEMSIQMELSLGEA